MLARRKLDNKYFNWNWKWRAPFGRVFFKKHIPQKYWETKLGGKLVGMYAFQPNSDTRIFEYPWAVDTAKLIPGMNVIDLGGGFSGFSFTLSKMGVNVTNVDPFYDYGPTKHYNENPDTVINRLNRIFGAKVVLKHGTLRQANLPDEQFDRVFCISTIEHLNQEEIASIMKEIHRLLKPSGLCILTVDLFLNLIPFTDRTSNEYGCNFSIKTLIDLSEMSLAHGKKEELFGYNEFDPQHILRNLEKYFMGSGYPVLIQTIVLQKRNHAETKSNDVS